jgi:Ca-activated chloride channel family protein
MHLLAPDRLWLLTVVGGLLVAYAVLQRRRRHRAVRHPDVALVRAVSPRRAGWRRHLTAGALVLALVAMVLGLARPATARQVSRPDAVVMLALDTSLSMTATDVSPNRIDVAVQAAKDLLAPAPDGYRIGLVTYNASAEVAVPPSTDRAALVKALDDLELARGTVGGDAVAAALDAIEAATTGQVTKEDDTYRAIVLLSDGDTTGGLSLDDAAAKAKDAGVPVYTVAYGTDAGVVTVDGEAIPVPADPAAMAKLAQATVGETYTAEDAAGLASVYDAITTRISTTTEQVELTVPLAGAAAVALVAAFLLSLAYTPRLV